MAGDFDINDADFAADATQSIDTVVARVRYVNELLNPDAPIARRGTGDGIATLRHGDIDALCDEVERLTGMGDAYRTTIADYDSRVGALQDEVERLREDAARLDWLERNGAVEFCSEPCLSGWRSWSEFDRHTLRAAIDATRTTGGRDA